MPATSSYLPEEMNQLVASVDALPPFKNHQYTNSLNGFKEKLHQIHELYNVQRYRIAFIGAPGRGKTTAICNWLGLLKSEKLKAKTLSELCLLLTGAGRTTIAEVHIDQTESASWIELEYAPLKQQEEYIRSYCEYYYNIVLGKEDSTYDKSESNEFSPHLEIDRAVRNMAQLKDISPTDIENQTPQYQEARAMIDSCPSLRHFEKLVFQRINLAARQMTKISYEQNQATSFQSWIKDEFKRINNGMHPSTSIAQKIKIHISKNDFNLHLPPYVCEIIDTKGLDTSARPDLLELMKAPDTICFIMDEVTSVPSAPVRHILNDSFTCKNDRYLSKKAAIIIRSTDEQLAQVNESEGDPDLGKKHKLNELMRKINSDHLFYELSNTLFIDIGAPYLMMRRPITKPDAVTGEIKRFFRTEIVEYDKEIAHQNNEWINEHIQKIINNLHETLEKDAATIRENILHLIDAAEQEEARNAQAELRTVKERILKEKEAYLSRFSNPSTMNFSADVVKAAVEDIAWQTVRKMNQCYGGYQTWHTNIFDEIESCGRHLFAKRAKEIDKIIHDCLIDVRQAATRRLTNGFLHTLDKIIKEHETASGKDFFNWAYKKAFFPQSAELPFWNEVNAIKGQGYRQRVIGSYKLFLKKQNADTLLGEIIQKHETAVFDTVLNLL